VEAFGQQQGRAGLEPVHSRGNADRRGLERLLERSQIEGELDNRMCQVFEIH
jgi:hypothetical protein